VPRRRSDVYWHGLPQPPQYRRHWPQGVIDDGFYQAPGGLLSFIEDLSVPGAYTIETYRKVVRSRLTI
jgi:hypothetical protein